jgi:GTP-binding protein HflX
MDTVERTLEELGLGQIPRLLVFNKSDRISPELRAQHLRAHPQAVALSAQDLGTTAPLLSAIEEQLWARGVEVPLLAAEQGRH